MHSLKINYCAGAHQKERARHPVQQCGSLMRLRTTMELNGPEEYAESGLESIHCVLWPSRAIQ